MLLNTKHISELIKAGDMSQIKEAMEQSLSPGSQTFEQALFNLIHEGRISVDEAMVNSDSPTNLHWLLNNAAKPVSGAQHTPAPAPGSRPPVAADDISNIKLNLDALG